MFADSPFFYLSLVSVRYMSFWLNRELHDSTYNPLSQSDLFAANVFPSRNWWCELHHFISSSVICYCFLFILDRFQHRKYFGQQYGTQYNGSLIMNFAPNLRMHMHSCVFPRHPERQLFLQRIDDLVSSLSSMLSKLPYPILYK